LPKPRLISFYTVAVAFPRNLESRFNLSMAARQRFSKHWNGTRSTRETTGSTEVE
jgi:hypothetical protein